MTIIKTIGASGGGAGGLTAVNASANVALGVTNTCYECNLSTAAFTITLPGGTTAAVIEFNDALGVASSTNYLEIIPGSGQSIGSYGLTNSVALDYPNFNYTLYRAAGDTVWRESQQLTTGGTGGLLPQAVATNVSPAVNDVMYSFDLTSGPYSLTLPGGTTACVVGFIDAKGLGSAAKYLRIIPASGQSIDTYVADDTLDMDYAGFSGTLYRTAGSTNWAWDRQLTSLVQPGQLPGQTSGLTIAPGFVGERINGTLNATTMTTSGVDYQAGVIPLPPGVWLVYATINSGAGATSHSYTQVSLNTSIAINTATLVRAIDSNVGVSKVVAALPYYVNTSSTLTVYAVVTAVFTGTAPSTSSSVGSIYAVRVG